MSEGLDDLAAVIDSLLDVDPNSLPDAELHDLVEQCRVLRHADARKMVA